MSTIAAARRIPLTITYVAVLVGTTITLHLLGPVQRHRVLAASSTNLHELSRVPVRVLAASALWISSGRVLPWAVLLGAVGGALEWRVGSRSTALVFASGHVFASILVGLGLAAGIAWGIVSPSIEHVIDVGPSYGFAAIAAGLSGLVGRRWLP
ncbi:MAG: rhomboid-like protein [Acidimicrobiia bacterium]